MATSRELDELRRRVTELEAYAVMSHATFLAVAGSMTQEQRATLASGLESTGRDAQRSGIAERAEFQDALRAVAWHFAQELREKFGIRQD